jgi:integrase
MPRTNRPPSYRLHKARSCAVVTIDGKNHYLGPYGSAESHEKYARLLAEWRLHSNHLLPTTGPRRAASTPSVNELILAYFRHVQSYYIKDGRPTSEQDNIRQALRFVRQLFGASPAIEFGPVALANVRQAMIAAGRSRKLINKDVNRVRGMFGWAVEHELLPVEVHQALRRVKGLRKGRSDAREIAPVEPVAEESIRAILPHLSPQVAAMIQLQHLCGARPQEVVSIRPGEVETSGEVWLYQPWHHKTEHFDRRKVIMLGPRAQEVLRPWLERDAEAYCFAPAEASAWHYRRTRKLPPEASSEEGGSRALRLRPGQKYTRHSYRVAVQRACKRAGIPAWSPRQLRHARATAIRKAFGLEAAKAVLGHTDTKITEIYAERDLELARRVMREIG